MSASPEWWDRFQWSDRNQAANLLAQLLGNRRGDPAVCLTSAPDVLFLLDEGNLTQRRTNPIFPDDFRGQWLDLLNPTKDDWNAPNPLNEALLGEGLGSLGATRIIVVQGQPDQKTLELPEDLDADEKEQLERLAVFHFGFSIQAAYAMMNYGRQDGGRMTWIDVDEKLKELVAKKLLYRTRGHFYIPRQFVPRLREGKYNRDPDAHLHAAKSLTPILEPLGLFIASNRDRALEPEPVLEATWHLQRARMLLPPRDKKTRPRCLAAVSTLTFLRPFADWDTLKQLQHATDMHADAVELGRELLNKETAVTKRAPHSSRIAALLNAIGGLGHSLGGDGAAELRTQLAEEATTLHAKRGKNGLRDTRCSGAHGCFPINQRCCRDFG